MKEARPKYPKPKNIKAYRIHQTKFLPMNYLQKIKCIRVCYKKKKYSKNAEKPFRSFLFNNLKCLMESQFFFLPNKEVVYSWI